MTALYFITVYGWFVGMIIFAWVMEPKPSKGNSGVRL
jgi:hypothetical protein